MNPGEIWRREDGSLRLVVSNATYNTSNLNRVITAVVEATAAGFDPFAVETPHGTVHADRLAMHPRNWLRDPVARIGDQAMETVRTHLRFLVWEA